MSEPPAPPHPRRRRTARPQPGEHTPPNRSDPPGEPRSRLPAGRSPRRRPPRDARSVLTATVIAGIAGAMALAGCGAPAQAGAGANRLRLAFDSDPQCIDGQQMGNNTALTVARQLTDSLTDQDPESGAIVPWLAASWRVSADSKTFDFTLRNGVRFSDGTRFTAESVKENLEGIAGLGAKAQLGSTYLAGLSKVTAHGEHRVTVAFSAPNAQFLQATSTMTLGMYSHATLQRSPEQRCTGRIEGTGPFTVGHYTPGDGVSLERRADYDWPSSRARHAGPAHVDGVDIGIVPESSVRTGSLSAGDIDVDTAVQQQDEEALEASDFTIAARANPGLVYSLMPNEKNAILADPDVRRAIGAAVDRPELAAVLSHHQAPATSLLAKSTPGYRDHSAQLAHDPARAAALLERAGWRADPATGMRSRNGTPLRLSVRYWQTAPFIELVAQQLREVGIDLQLKKSTLAETTAARAAGDYDLEFSNLTRADPDIVRTLFDARGRNINQRAPGRVEDLLNASAAQPDQRRRGAQVDGAVTELLTAGHAIPLVELSGVMSVRPGVRDLDFDASSRLQLYDTSLAAAGAQAPTSSRAPAAPQAADSRAAAAHEGSRP